MNCMIIKSNAIGKWTKKFYEKYILLFRYVCIFTIKCTVGEQSKSKTVFLSINKVFATNKPTDNETKMSMDNSNNSNNSNETASAADLIKIWHNSFQNDTKRSKFIAI